MHCVVTKIILNSHRAKIIPDCKAVGGASPSVDMSNPVCAVIASFLLMVVVAIVVLGRLVRKLAIVCSGRFFLVS